MIIISVLIITWFGLLDARLINSELAKDLSVYLCSHISTYSYANMNYFQHPIQFCVTLKSNKGIRDEIRDLQFTTSLQSLVSISWRQLATSNSCRLTYKGYQSEYRISPDLGNYEQCQNSISRHLFKLSKEMNKRTEISNKIHFNSTNLECPITEVPSTYPEYIACKFIKNEWYLIEWNSKIRYETFRNGDYGTYWANDTQTFVVRMKEELRRNGTESHWLKRLIRIESSLNGCDNFNALINFAEGWPSVSNTVILTYRIFDGNMKIYSEHIGTIDIEKWRQIKMSFKRITGYHELCAQMVSPAVSRYHVCSKIVDAEDCSFFSSDSSFFQLSPIFLFLFFYFHFC